MAEKDVLDKLNAMHTDIVLIRSDLKVTQEDVLDHHKILYGNGREGLKIRVDRIETANKTVHKVWGVIVTALAGLSAWLGMEK